MQSTLGRKGDYSVRAMLSIARHYEDRLKAREIAEEMDIPRRYLTQILANLVQQDLLDAVAGPAGGYCLSRPPKKITLLQIVEAAEGGFGLDKCVLNGGPCTWQESCPVHIPWARAQNAMAVELAKTTLANLATASTEIDEGTHELPPDAPPHKVSTPRLRRKTSGKKK